MTAAFSAILMANAVLTLIHRTMRNSTTVTGVTGRRFGSLEKNIPSSVAMAITSPNGCSNAIPQVSRCGAITLTHTHTHIPSVGHLRMNGTDPYKNAMRARSLILPQNSDGIRVTFMPVKNARNSREGAPRVGADFCPRA